MTKALYSIILLTFACLALMFILSSSHASAAPIATPDDSSTGSLYIHHAGLNYLAQAAAQAEEHYCAGHCRKHYEERMRECNEPGHPQHHRCEEWAREREKECLDECYKEHPRY
jgi:hypothetical protein